MGKQLLQGLIGSLFIFIISSPFGYGIPKLNPSDYLGMVNKQLNEYGQAFPEIFFYRLYAPDAKIKLRKLMQDMGSHARNVDYEHPPAARQLLIEAQMGRIESMLEYRQPSATLFQHSPTENIPQSHICIITLDLKPFLGDEMAATRFMSSEDESKINDYPDQAMLNNAQFLQFTLDHELFHCVDAYMNGPSHGQTSSQVTASYFDFKSEQRADFYAGLLSRLRFDNANTFIQKLAYFRTLSFKNWDITHYTAPLLNYSLRIKMNDIPNKLRELCKFAAAHADKKIMNEKNYRRFLISATALAIQLGITEVDQTPAVLELLENDAKHDVGLVTKIKQQLIHAEYWLANANNINKFKFE